MHVNPLTLLLLLVGIVYIVVGLVTTYFPPKTINGLYGYRSRKSKLNQRTWDAANQYSSSLFLQLGVLFIILGGGAYFLPDWGVWQVGVGLLMIILASAAMMYFTERFLNSKFDNEGNPLND